MTRFQPTGDVEHTHRWADFDCGREVPLVVCQNVPSGEDHTWDSMKVHLKGFVLQLACALGFIQYVHFLTANLQSLIAHIV